MVMHNTTPTNITKNGLFHVNEYQTMAGLTTILSSIIVNTHHFEGPFSKESAISKQLFCNTKSIESQKMLKFVLIVFNRKIKYPTN